MTSQTLDGNMSRQGWDGFGDGLEGGISEAVAWIDDEQTPG